MVRQVGVCFSLADAALELAAQRESLWTWWRFPRMPSLPCAKSWTTASMSLTRRKKLALQKKKQKQTQVKEMKFRPGTDQRRLPDIKLRNLTRFLENGDKAKVTLRFRGREMAHQQLGMEMMKRVEVDLPKNWLRSNSIPRWKAAR